MTTLHTLWCIIILAPLLGCIIAGFFRNQIGRRGAHSVTLLGVGTALLSSLWVAKLIFLDGVPKATGVLYTWALGAPVFNFTFNIGYLIDPLTSIMFLVVTFVSFLVHVYSIGYMVDDDGYQRFFSYISLFTFFMLMLVSANNFLQLFFGWEGVGLVSYLLIGFWYKKESALQGSLKAFLVNRVGDMGFIIGIGLVLAYAGSVNYQQVFQAIPSLTHQTLSIFPGTHFSIITVMCIFLFIGAMGKSAQVPLHIWLPESMEGPTPISALIHAATMVTAGVFMVARLSPIFEFSPTARSFILIIGATGALFTGLIAIVMNDIKRVVAYSTLSQLGYMMVAMGTSAYAAGMFHLATHACFKALLFLGAGSVIIAMHHEQDMRKMGGLAKLMPITYITYLIGTLALVAVPPFAGFYSKDIIIDAAHTSTIAGSHYAYFCVLVGAFVTALYSFRSLFMTFHGKPRMDKHSLDHVKESPWVVTVPLIALAIPSVILGYILIGPILFNSKTILSSALFVLPQNNVLAKIGSEYHGPFSLMLHSVLHPTFWFALLGFVVAYVGYIAKPELPSIIAKRFKLAYTILLAKYGFDALNDTVFIRGGRGLGRLFFNVGDKKLIDGVMVNGSALMMRWIAFKARVLQSGYLYHYATVMVVALLLVLAVFLTMPPGVLG